MNLQQLFESKGIHYYTTDKGSEHSYLEYYSELFLPYKNAEINLIEIGFWIGGDLRMFEDWFTKANIIGYDIEDYNANTGITLTRAKKIIKSLHDFTEDEFKDNPPTIIIDDATHDLKDQLKMVELCYPQLKQGGVMVIEDIQNFDYIKEFIKIGIPFETVDLREKKNRWDDVLLVYRK